MFYKIIRNFIIIFVLFAPKVQATDTFKSDLDNCNPVAQRSTSTGPSSRLSISYYEPEKNDRFTWIHQNCYTVCNIANNQNDVVVIGYLNPCIGIAVTNGKKLVTFHKDHTSSLQAMQDIISKELDLTCKENLHARLYSVRNDSYWNKNYARLYNNTSHVSEMTRVKDCLVETLDVERHKVLAQFYKLETKMESGHLNFSRREMPALCIAIRLNSVFENKQQNNQDKQDKQIKFSFIDPVIEDILHLKGQYISINELASSINGIPAHNTKTTDSANEPKILYDFIPKILFDSKINVDCYKVMTRIHKRYMNNEELVLRCLHFKDNPAELIFLNAYNKANFYRVN